MPPHDLEDAVDEVLGTASWNRSLMLLTKMRLGWRQRRGRVNRSGWSETAKAF